MNEPSQKKARLDEVAANDSDDDDDFLNNPEILAAIDAKVEEALAKSTPQNRPGTVVQPLMVIRDGAKLDISKLAGSQPLQPSSPVKDNLDQSDQEITLQQLRSEMRKIQKEMNECKEQKNRLNGEVIILRNQSELAKKSSRRLDEELQKERLQNQMAMSKLKNEFKDATQRLVDQLKFTEQEKLQAKEEAQRVQAMNLGLTSQLHSVLSAEEHEQDTGNVSIRRTTPKPGNFPTEQSFFNRTIGTPRLSNVPRVQETPKAMEIDPKEPEPMISSQFCGGGTSVDAEMNLRDKDVQTEPEWEGGQVQNNESLTDYLRDAELLSRLRFNLKRYNVLKYDPEKDRDDSSGSRRQSDDPLDFYRLAIETQTALTQKLTATMSSATSVGLR